MKVVFVVVVVVVCCCVVFWCGFVVGVWEVSMDGFQVNRPETNCCGRLLHEVLFWSQGLFCCCCCFVVVVVGLLVVLVVGWLGGDLRVGGLGGLGLEGLGLRGLMVDGGCW